MTRAEREQIDTSRRALDGLADKPVSKPPSEAFRQNFDRIQWRKRKPAKETEPCQTT